ncbi:MAG: hypothetical protein AB7C90_00095 [Bacteroidales bacterium]
MVSSRLFLYFLLLILLVAGVAACSRGYTPRPAGYLRIDLPEKSYRLYDSLTPYLCEIPRYAVMERVNASDSGFTWWNLSFPRYHATIYLTYAPLQGNLATYISDSRQMTYAHAQKANAIEEIPFSYPDRAAYGMVFNVKGNVATAVQFYITDSVNHFLRGALYFPVAPNQDSLAPVVDFFSQDIARIVQTLRWRP